MNVPFLLSEAQIARMVPLFPKPRGGGRKDDRLVISGIVYVKKNGLEWHDAPPGYGPHKTLYNRFARWSKKGIFARIFAELAASCGEPEAVMIDATYVKAHRTAASLAQKKISDRVVSAARKAASRPRSPSCATSRAVRSS